MQSNTVAELVEAAGTAGTSLLKEYFVRRAEGRRKEREFEMQKQLLAAQSDDSGDVSTQEAGASVVGTLGEAETVAQQYDSLLAEAAELEDCDLCTALIEEARNRPAAEQADLIPELRAFLEDVEDGTPTHQVAQRARKREALMGLLQDAMGQ